MTQSKYWMFTIFGDDIIEAFSLAALPPVQYCVYQLEECPDTGRRHLQGYLELDRRMRLASVQGVLGVPDAHLEVRKGNQAQAIDYCTKIDTRIAGPYVVGSPTESHRGRRSDLDEVVDAIREGKRGRELWAEHARVMIKYPRGIQEMVDIYIPPRNPMQPVHVCWLWGQSGLGKSRTAYELTAGVETYWKPDSSKWWPRYTGQSVVVIDDFEPHPQYGMPLKYWLRVLDRYPMQVEKKGSYIELAATTFVMTHVDSPDSALFQWDQDGQLRRRITQVIQVTEEAAALPVLPGLPACLSHPPTQPSYPELLCPEEMEEGDQLVPENE